MEHLLEMGKRRELFFDDYFWRDVGTARRRVHTPLPREIVLHWDAPADGNITSLYSVIHDGRCYALYYTASFLDEMCGPWPHQHICRAESEDGLHWYKPDLGLYEFHGSRHNNIVYLLPDDLLDNFCVFVDTNPACPAGERCKALAERVIDGKPVLNALVSADGIHWRDLGTVLREGTFDTLNTCHWDAAAGLYRAYVRSWERHDPPCGLGESGEKDACAGADLTRTIVTATSPDFLHWSGVRPIEYGDAPRYQMYTNNITPYYRAPHILLGFPTRYYERTWCPNFEKMPFVEHRRERIRRFSSQRHGTAVSDGLFMAGRDGVHFTRFDDEPFFPCGMEGDGNWIYGDAYPAHGLIQTPSAAPGEPEELSFFAQDNKAGALRRHTLRLDGFVSLHCPSTPTQLCSRPLRFTGSRLECNFTTSAAGYLYAQLETPQGEALPGFSLQECDETFGDSTARCFSWQGSTDVSAASGQAVCLRLVCREADIYSLRFY